MGDTLLPFIFILAVGFYYYGPRTLVLTAVSIASCVVFEYLYRRIMSKSNSIGDLTAIVTGCIIAFNLPATAPVWFPVVGAFFAVVIVKQLFGGIGYNIFNPAAAALCFLTVGWPGIMSKIPLPFQSLSMFATPHNFETSRLTPVSELVHHAMFAPGNSPWEMFFGYRPGYLGTISILVIVIGFAVLLYRRIVSFRVPLSFLATVALVAFLFPRYIGGRGQSVFYELTSGAVIFAAVFMLTDPVTTPVTKTGRLLFGFLCGLITMLLRYFGQYQEGVYFAILFMNPFVMALDRIGWKFETRGGRQHVKKVSAQK